MIWGYGVSVTSASTPLYVRTEITVICLLFVWSLVLLYSAVYVSFGHLRNT